MRAEDYDWTIYHIIGQGKGCTIGEIEERCGYEMHIVEESLSRLHTSLLIERRGDLYRARSIEEFLITSQLNQDPFSNICIEDGVVKVRTNNTVPGRDTTTKPDIGGES